MNKYIDQTILLPTKNDIDYSLFYDQAINYKFFAVCVPPFKVLESSNALKNSATQVCTVIGFPNGHHVTQIKTKETEIALNQGANEIDMVANLSWIKSSKWDKLEKEIKAIKLTCNSNILKVIIESSLLEESEIKNCCKVIKNAGADFIKTSTGFHGPGAKLNHVKIMKKELENSNVKIKASGGIRDLAKAKEFIAAGCSRIGTSSGVKIMNQHLGKDINETTSSTNY